MLKILLTPIVWLLISILRLLTSLKVLTKDRPRWAVYLVTLAQPLRTDRVKLPPVPGHHHTPDPAHPWPYNPTEHDRFRCRNPNCGFSYPAPVICPKCDDACDVPIESPTPSDSSLPGKGNASARVISLIRPCVEPLRAAHA